jgi:DNA-directed RNA polymerase specialized sigma24 family protein
LYYLETLTIEEIAEILNVPTGMVKSRLFYARKMMTKALHGEQDSPQSAGAKHE